MNEECFFLVFVDVRDCVCMYVCAQLHIYVCVNTSMYACMYVCMYE